jgi:hypothetical protein
LHLRWCHVNQEWDETRTNRAIVIAGTIMTKDRNSKPPQTRFGRGRPPKDARDVKSRILDAAQQVFARVITGLTNFEDYEPSGRSVTDKLTSVGTELVERFLEDTVGVTRATIAEADRFPALSRHVHEAGRDRAAAAVSHVLNDATHMLQRSSKGPFSTKRSLATAQIFMDLILLPMLMRALMGEDAKHLRKEVPSFVRERVNFFLAACETDWGR